MDNNQEYAEAYVADAQRATELMAEELIKLANDLRAYAVVFPKTLDSESRGTPTSLAADIMSQFNNRVGTIASTRLWTVVYGAGKAEKHLALTEKENNNGQES